MGLRSQWGCNSTPSLARSCMGLSTVTRKSCRPQFVRSVLNATENRAIQVAYR
jgi:hypothetical protein